MFEVSINFFPALKNEAVTERVQHLEKSAASGLGLEEPEQEVEEEEECVCDAI